MEPKIDPKIEQAKESLISRVEELGRRFKDVRERIDLDARIVAHPYAAIGIAFAAGALLGMRGGGKRDVPDEEVAQRTVTSAITAALTAIAMRLGRDYALKRVSNVAKTWFDKRKAEGGSRSERSASRDPSSVEPFLEH